MLHHIMNESMVKYTQKVIFKKKFMYHTCKNMKVASKCVEVQPKKCGLILIS